MPRLPAKRRPPPRSRSGGSRGPTPTASSRRAGKAALCARHCASVSGGAAGARLHAESCFGTHCVHPPTPRPLQPQPPLPPAADLAALGSRHAVPDAAAFLRAVQKLPAERQHRLMQHAERVAAHLQVGARIRSVAARVCGTRLAPSPMRGRPGCTSPDCQFLMLPSPLPHPAPAPGRGHRRRLPGPRAAALPRALLAPARGAGGAAAGGADGRSAAAAGRAGGRTCRQLCKHGPSSSFLMLGERFGSAPLPVAPSACSSPAGAPTSLTPMPPPRCHPQAAEVFVRCPALGNTRNTMPSIVRLVVEQQGVTWTVPA